MTEKQGAGMGYLPSSPSAAETTSYSGLAADSYLDSIGRSNKVRDSVYSKINDITGGSSVGWDYNKMTDAQKSMFTVEEMDWIKNNRQTGPWYKDTNLMGNVAGLASSLVQVAALPSMLENARLQNRSLKHNLSVAKEEQARRNKNIKELNAVGSRY